MGNNCIKNIPQDINQEKAREEMFVWKHFWHISLTIPMKNGNMVTLETNAMILKKINDKISANLAINS